MPLTAFEDFFYGACLRDWDAEGERMQRLLARFDAADEVRIVGDGDRPHACRFAGARARSTTAT